MSRSTTLLQSSRPPGRAMRPYFDGAAILAINVPSIGSLVTTLGVGVASCCVQMGGTVGAFLKCLSITPIVPDWAHVVASMYLSGP